MRDDTTPGRPAVTSAPPTATPAPTPRTTRLRLNRLERFLRARAEALTAAGHGPALVRLRGLFELAFTAEHAEYLDEEVRSLLAAEPVQADDPAARPRR